MSTLSRECCIASFFFFCPHPPPPLRAHWAVSADQVVLGRKRTPVALHVQGNPRRVRVTYSWAQCHSCFCLLCSLSAVVWATSKHKTRPPPPIHPLPIICETPTCLLHAFHATPMNGKFSLFLLLIGIILLYSNVFLCMGVAVAPFFFYANTAYGWDWLKWRHVSNILWIACTVL